MNCIQLPLALCNILTSYHQIIMMSIFPEFYLPNYGRPLVLQQCGDLRDVAVDLQRKQPNMEKRSEENSHRCQRGPGQWLRGVRSLSPGTVVLSRCHSK